MIQSFKVATTLAAQRVVAISAADTVGYPTGIANSSIGITKDTVLGTDNAIPVAGAGEMAKLYFNDTVAAGALVAADTSGRGIPFVAAGTTTSSNAYVGVLVGEAVAATATIAQVLILPGLGG